jgi:hypothetical protein
MVQAHYITEEEKTAERTMPLSFEMNSTVAPDPAEDAENENDFESEDS